MSNGRIASHNPFDRFGRFCRLAESPCENIMKQILRYLILLLPLLMVACNSGSSGSSNSSHSPVVNPSPQPSASPAVSPSPSPTPSVTPSPLPTSTPAPQPVDGHYLYVLNFSTNVERCQLDNESGGLMNCIPTATGIGDALGITLNPTKTLAYISDGSNVEECQISATDGTLNQCVPTGSEPIGDVNYSVYGITISPDNSYAYMISVRNDIYNVGYVQCQINQSDGGLFNCTRFVTGNNVSDVKVGPNSNFLYISGEGLELIPISSTTGSTNEASGYSIAGEMAEQMAFNKTGAYLYSPAYYTNNAITQCQINNTTGAPANCSQTGTNFIFPYGIALDDSNTYAYVSNYESTTVTRCQVSSTDGSFSNCIQSPSLFNRPIDLAYY